jgi:hypothetical protein
MKWLFSGGAGAASVVALSMVAFAQGTQQGGAPQTQTGGEKARAGAGQQVTLVGCVQREADYRKAADAGKGGAAGTGVGVGNEFVLINASMSSGSGSSAQAGTSTGTSGAATGTSGTAANAYELTGSNESQAEKYVGKRVEIMGMLKPAETTASGAPTGGPTAGQPPRGVDVTSKDLQLREIEVSSVKETTGTCQS